LNGLDLFSGIGGITLALSEWVRPIAYCEIDRYCQGVLLSRMRSGDISTAPIWDDVRTLKGEMLPKVDIIYGGFPCQDISTAGHGKGYWAVEPNVCRVVNGLPHRVDRVKGLGNSVVPLQVLEAFKELIGVKALNRLTEGE